MEHKIASFISQKLVSSSVIPMNIIDIYTYGLELIISFLVTSFIIVVIGIITSQITSSIMFLLVFILLRRFTGGYHAKTHLRCKLCTVIIYIINLFFINHFEFTYKQIILLVLFGFFVTICFSPVPNEYKPIPIERRPYLKKISVIIYVLLSIIALVLYNYEVKFSSGIIISLVSVAALIIIEKINQRRSKNEKDFTNNC
jgi:accessory gene regulator B